MPKNRICVYMYVCNNNDNQKPPTHKKRWSERNKRKRQRQERKKKEKTNKAVSSEPVVHLEKEQDSTWMCFLY